ncbi:peptidoglycan DD-metalloendopeptidase family protein [Alphaproteobacteria bacterium]|nr:peptidoglycan DD-metalloendopeptidase family protein [Alphaproteobacteria bacterium]
MKKVFNNNALYKYLIVFVLSALPSFYLSVKIAVASSIQVDQNNLPLKRPVNLASIEESSDTIHNMTQKIGAKLTADIKKTKLKKNENLSSALSRVKFSSKDISFIVNSIYKLKNGKNILSTLPVGMDIHYSIPTNVTGGALKLNFSKKRDIFVWQDFENNYLSKIFLRPTKSENTLIKGIIKSSLYLSAIKSGVPENTLLEMISLLGFSVDFQREIREGDSFEIMFTKEIDLLKDRLMQTKPITYVSINLSGNKLGFYKYYDEYGIPQYYDKNGNSSKRTIMKTPINGAKLTSRYGNRKHPVLGYTKLHRGLDFAAPTGTPIFAAGDGIIEKAGWNGSYGRYIRIRHTGTYKTAYAHLSRIHKKIKIGSRVSQGKTIGYVGSSGRSTGAHLHYEVLRNNRQVNPMNIKLPAGKNISKEELSTFKKKVVEILNQKLVLEQKVENKKVATNSYETENFY